MASSLLPDVLDILNRLLDQHEQPARQRVARVRLGDHAAYAGAARADVNAALQQLASHGGVRLVWRKWEENNWLDAVDLVPENAATVYALLDRLPLNDRVGRLRQWITSQTPQAAWHAAFLAQTLAQLDAGRSVAPLDTNDRDASADLLKALDAIAQLSAPTLERVLSVQVFHDSKRFEALRSKVITVLRRHNPDADQFGDDDQALLREHFVERVPEYVPISGPLVLDLAGTDTEPAPSVDLAPFAPSVALPATLLRRAKVTACSARVIMTVENLTSFSELVTRRPAGWLLVYIGGFASPTVIALLQQVSRVARHAHLRHWGDLDAGGLRILAHLRQHLGTVAATAMDCATLQTYAAFAQPLTVSDRRALERLKDAAILSDCADLIDALLAQGIKLEQEAVQIEDIAAITVFQDEFCP